MSGTNPGTWPDMGNGAYVTSASSPVPVGPLYTASDLKAAKLETVERCLSAVLAFQETTTPEEEETVLGAFMAIVKIKEEINAS